MHKLLPSFNKFVMNRQALDTFIDITEDMKKYLRHNGWHFNKKAYDYAVSKMKRKNPSSDKMEKVEPVTKEQVEEMLVKNGVKVENSVGYDCAYVATMIKADFWKSSIEDERHMALMIKNFIDDADQADGYIMFRWYADSIRNGLPIFWEDLV